MDLPLYDLDTIADATGNFSMDNKLGEGGFGPVYKGKLRELKEIAVKRLSETSTQGLAEFKNEVTLIAKLQHRNLVRLLGCCIQAGERMLIYEYMPHGSLDSFLFGKGLELADASMGPSSLPVAEVMKCIKVGLLCVQDRPEYRPTMSSVVEMLGGDSALLPQPRQPGFIVAEDPSETNSSTSKQDSSTNHVSMTMLEGR
ncbi:hypothetical protein C4D60_Mb04t31150 [Musa balbisiana]|uniref:Protein kinase domain-containing protein n=2 Tax=Musa balbisiana TaxID=52838 RepID=A0A4S8KG23_MUSBA|nr:hypothetical protein C4D60_Mb04t31150 [Musa balbisiana]